MAGLSFFSRLRAIVWLRFTLWKHGLRRSTGIVDAGAGILLNLIAAVTVVLMAAGVALLIRHAVGSDDSDLIRITYLIVLYAAAFFALVVPVIPGATRGGLQTARLLVFPLRRSSLYAISLAASAFSGVHLIWYPSLATAAVGGVFFASSNAAIGLLVLLLAALMLIIWSHTILLLLETILRRRSVKEVVLVAAVVVIVAASLTPALIDTGVISAETRVAVVHLVSDFLLPLISWLPLTVAAHGLASLHSGSPAAAIGAAAWLLVWTGLGLAVGLAVFSRGLMEGGAGTARPRAKRARGQNADDRSPRLDLFAWLPRAVTAVMVKELHYLARSGPGKLAMLIAPLFVVMMGLAVGKLMFAKQELFGVQPATYIFYGVMLYAATLSSNFLANSFAWEGSGVTAYFLGPLSARQIIVGKNLGVWLYEALLFGLCLATWSVVLDVPNATTMISGALAFAVGVLVLSTAGNFTSINFPVKRSISSLSNSASQVGTLVTVACVGVAVTLVGFAVVLGASAGGALLQLILLVVLVAALLLLYLLLLGVAASLLEDRQEQLIETLGGVGDESL